MRIQLGYGKGTQEVVLPDKNVLGILESNPIPPGPRGEEEVRRALEEPIGAPPMQEVFHPGEKIAIITSDITRPCPTAVILPLVLDKLYLAGVSPEDITLVFALGGHRHHTEEERRRLAGERAWKEIRCVDSDPDDCVCLGQTSRSTPVEITRVVAEADRRICLGNIEYHYFAGYSGGGKAIMPGVSTRAAIQANHSRMIQPEAHAGRLEGNPVREDIEEAAALCGVDYIVNVVLDEHKEIVRAVAGDSVLAHREGCAFLDTLYGTKISQRADIVLVSQGGRPKDLNLYQTQKALDNAKHAVRDGGVIILVGSCEEGLGEATFERWMKEAEKPQDLIDCVKRHFELGGHKAAAIAMVLEKAAVYLVSEMPETLVRECFLTPFPSVQQAFDEAFARLGEEAAVWVMPHGGSTLPLYRPQS